MTRIRPQTQPLKACSRMLIAATAGAVLILTSACGGGDTENNSEEDVSTSATTSDAGNAPTDSSEPGYGKCDFSPTALSEGKAPGLACTSDDECLHGHCLQPGADGNLVNSSFGFCVRGCDCGDTETRLSDTEKETMLCLLPPGFEGRKRHTVLRCTTLADCQAIEPQWTDCRTPSSGAATPVCHAD